MHHRLEYSCQKPETRRMNEFVEEVSGNRIGAEKNKRSVCYLSVSGHRRPGSMIGILNHFSSVPISLSGLYVSSLPAMTADT